MIGQTITKDKDGNPLNPEGKMLSQSALVLPPEVKNFFAKFQGDYNTAYLLQRKPLDEFDGYSLLDRARIDQETFGAFVGVEFLPIHKRWRFRGRKNTARNKVIGILAHLITGMLFPAVFAQNDQDEEDKMTARVMAILVEEHLKKAGYEYKFLQLALCMLVNPAVFAEVEYAVALQKIKQKLKNGKIEVRQAVDEALSGLQLHVVPVDELLLGDLYSGLGNLHTQPFIFRVRRITYDHAKAIYAGKYKDKGGKDLFDYVEAGKTRWLEDGQGQTLFDIEWTEADGNFVQEVTGYWRTEDIEVTFVGGVPMCNWDDIYNSNPFHHRRMVLSGKEWLSVPVYPFVMSGFEPIDPAGRFVYYKSASFKEYWEDQKINEIDRAVVDGVKLDVMKPIFVSGVAKFDSQVMVPGASVAMPQGAKVDAYSLGPNLAAAYRVIMDSTQDMSESTQDRVMQGGQTPNVTATQTVIAQRQARVFLGVAGISVAHLVRQIGELVVDCVIQHTTIGELDASVPESMRMRYKTILAKGRDGGRNVTNRIVFTDRFLGKKMTKQEEKRRNWNLFVEAGENTDQRIWEVNPYRFARTRYSLFVDADRMVMRAMGADRAEKDLAFEKMMDPRVMPFINPEAVVTDFVIDEYAGGDPDKYKAKQEQQQFLQALLGAQRSEQAAPASLPERQEQLIGN